MIKLGGCLFESDRFWSGGGCAAPEKKMAIKQFSTPIRKPLDMIESKA